MAQTEVVVRLIYENGDQFKMTAKGGNGEEVLTVCHFDENGHITQTWPSAKKMCADYFDYLLDQAGAEMKKENEGGS